MPEDEIQVNSSNARFDEWYDELHATTSEPDPDVDETIEDDYSEDDYE